MMYYWFVETRTAIEFLVPAFSREQADHIAFALFGEEAIFDRSHGSICEAAALEIGLDIYEIVCRQT